MSVSLLGGAVQMDAADASDNPLDDLNGNQVGERNTLSVHGGSVAGVRTGTGE